jgi:hypothetical protein
MYQNEIISNIHEIIYKKKNKEKKSENKYSNCVQTKLYMI